MSKIKLDAIKKNIIELKQLLLNESLSANTRNGYMIQLIAFYEMAEKALKADEE